MDLQYIVVEFEVMLTAGAIAAACCLAAAVITYCYTQPSSSLVNNNVEDLGQSVKKISVVASRLIIYYNCINY